VGPCDNARARTGPVPRKKEIAVAFLIDSLAGFRLVSLTTMSIFG
jgi:hypothetical protein